MMKIKKILVIIIISFFAFQDTGLPLGNLRVPLISQTQAPALLQTSEYTEEAYLHYLKDKLRLIRAYERKNGNFLDGVSDEDLKDRIKQRFQEFEAKIDEEGKTLDDLLVEVFATISAVVGRVMKDEVKEVYDEQLMCAIALHEGMAIEMENGEGKTLSIVIAAILNTLNKGNVHINTLRRHYAERDILHYGRVYGAFGLRVGLIRRLERGQALDAFFFDPKATTETYKYLRKADKREVYKTADVIYGDSQDFNFDKQENNCDRSLSELAWMPASFTIVDDGVDRTQSYDILKMSLPIKEYLIKEYVDPTEIREDKWLYNLATGLTEEDYTLNEKDRTVILGEAGVKKIRDAMEEREGAVNDDELREICLSVQYAKIAQICYIEEVHYIIKYEKILPVDECTGETKPNFEWPEIHRYLQIKHNIPITPRLRTVTEDTYRMYYKEAQEYGKLAITDGTINTVARASLDDEYGLRRVKIPRRFPSKRKGEWVFYGSSEPLRRAVVSDLGGYEEGCPVLIVPLTIKEDGEILEAFRTAGKYKEGNMFVLDPLHNDDDWLVTSKLREDGIVVISSRLSRGVDIVPIGKKGIEQGLRVFAIGIGTERRLSQTLGRTARGDRPGSTRWYISLDSELIRIYGFPDEKEAIKHFIEDGSLIGKVIPANKESNPDSVKEIITIINNIQRRYEAHYYVLRGRVMRFAEHNRTIQRQYYNVRNIILEGIEKGYYDLELLEGIDELWWGYLAYLEDEQWEQEDFTEYIRKSGEFRKETVEKMTNLLFTPTPIGYIQSENSQLVWGFTTGVSLDAEYIARLRKELEGLREARVYSWTDYLFEVKEFKDSEGAKLQSRLKIVEKIIIYKALEENNWHRKETTERLGISRLTLYRKIKDYGIDTMQKEDIEPFFQHLPEKLTLEELLREVEREIILATLERNNWSRKKTAEELNISRVTLYNKMKKLGIVEELPEKDAATQELIEASTEKEIILATLEKNHWHRKKTAQELNISRLTLYNKMKKYGLLELPKDERYTEKIMHLSMPITPAKTKEISEKFRTLAIQIQKQEFEINKLIGELFKEIMVAKGIDEKELAILTGINPNVISKMLLGEGSCFIIGNIKKCAKELSAPLGYFFSGQWRENENRELGNRQDIGENIKFYRLARGDTQTRFSQKTRYATATISNYETGASYPSPARLVILAYYLGISPYELLYVKDVPSIGDRIDAYRDLTSQL